MQTTEQNMPAEAQSFLTGELADCATCKFFEVYEEPDSVREENNCQKWLRNYGECPKDKAANGEVRGASRLAGEASSAEGATSTVMLGAERPGKG